MPPWHPVPTKGPPHGPWPSWLCLGSSLARDPQESTEWSSHSWFWLLVPVLVKLSKYSCLINKKAWFLVKCIVAGVVWGYESFQFYWILGVFIYTGWHTPKSHPTNFHFFSSPASTLCDASIQEMLQKLTQGDKGISGLCLNLASKLCVHFYFTFHHCSYFCHCWRKHDP